jgi:hypothetical protein
MRHTIAIFTLTLFLVVWPAAYPGSKALSQDQTLAQAQSQSQSLADLAKKEKERREKLAAGKPITNEDTVKYKNAAIATETANPPTDTERKTGEQGESKSKAEKNETTAKGDEPVDFQGRTESFWRQTFGDARQKVKSLEDESNVLTLKLNDLQNRFYREANGFKQQEIQRDIQKTIYEQDKNKEELKKAKDSLQDLEKEARKSGALPGWLTGKNP